MAILMSIEKFIKILLKQFSFNKDQNKASVKSKTTQTTLLLVKFITIPKFYIICLLLVLHIFIRYVDKSAL